MHFVKVWHGGLFGGLFNAISSFFGGGQQQGGNTYISQNLPPMPTVDDSAAKEREAADEAARKQRIEATMRSGSRQNILTDPNLATTFGSNPVARKNLLGNSAG